MPYGARLTGGVGGWKLFGQHSFELTTFHFPKLQNNDLDWSRVGAKKLPVVKMQFKKKMKGNVWSGSWRRNDNKISFCKEFILKL